MNKSAVNTCFIVDGLEFIDYTSVYAKALTPGLDLAVALLDDLKDLIASEREVVLRGNMDAEMINNLVT